MTSELPPPIPRNGPVGRYAPSPTGELHLGNLRTALIAWRDIRRLGGVFILRIEDLDRPRTVSGSEAQLIEDLRWLGIDWDEGPDVGGSAGPYRQSERDDLYRAALGRFAQQGLIYACTCSRKDLREASAPHGPEGPVYPGTCREKVVPIEEHEQGRASLRFRVEADPIIRINNAQRESQAHDLRTQCGDFIIKRRDGLFAYQLACAIDDALMGVTHVVRGEDLRSSAPRQVALMRALGFAPPSYEHVPLVADAQGRRMAKRDGSASLRELRNQGLTPEQSRELILNLPRVRTPPPPASP